MTRPENNVTPPATEHQGPVGTGPGLVRDIPPPGCDDAPAPKTPDDLLATITTCSTCCARPTRCWRPRDGRVWCPVAPSLPAAFFQCLRSTHEIRLRGSQPNN